jgi:hypothetical protein
MQAHPDAIKIEGHETLAQIITVLMSTSMFVSGFLGFVLDNTIPGEHTHPRSSLYPLASVLNCQYRNRGFSAQKTGIFRY